VSFLETLIFRINSNGEIKKVTGKSKGQSESSMAKGQYTDGPIDATGSVVVTAPWQGEGGG
jgi:hypothetical protein